MSELGGGVCRVKVLEKCGGVEFTRREWGKTPECIEVKLTDFAVICLDCSLSSS